VIKLILAKKMLPPAALMLILTPLFFQSAANKRAPTLESVLDDYLAALGGRDVLARVSDKVCSGQLVWSYPDQDPDRISIPAEIFAGQGDRWRLVLRTSKGAQGMGFDGENGWIQNADRILVDARQKRSKLAYLFSSRGPLMIEQFFPDLTLESRETIEGRTVYRVKSLATGKTEDHLYFDAETGLLIKIGEDLTLSDYREKDGVMYPFRITVERGNNTATYEFDSIATNLSLSPDRLRMPSPDEVFPDAFEGLAEPKVLPLLIDFPSGHEDMNVPCRDGRFLYDFIRRKNYRRGLEIGTFTGYSALWFGLAFKETGGRLITIEIDQRPGEEARRNFRKAGLEDVIDSRIADAFEEIQKIEGRFDFIFIDAWKPDYMRFLELLRDRVAPGGAIIAHNVTNYARDMREFLEAIKKDPGLETTLNETSAEGMSISIVRDPDSTTGAEIEASDFSPEELQADLMELREAMERLHPALYDHTTREEFDRLFDSGNRALSGSADLERAYQIYASLMAKIGCCHSSVWMPGGYWNNLPGRLFPIKLKFLGNRAFAYDSYSAADTLPTGSEVISINGKSMGEILGSVKSVVSADAYSEGYKNYRLGFRFPLIYSLFYGHPDSFSVTFTPPGGNGQEEKIIKPVPTNRIWGHIGGPGRLDIDIREEKNAAVMTISHFAYYSNHDKFFGFVDDAFERIAQSGIKHLILDLRGNSGGDPFCSSYLFAYLAREPVPYFAGPYGKYTSLAEPIELKKNHFTGRLFILIDGGGASTTGHLCGLLKYHELGTLIGEETGATYFCHDGHENLNLKHTRLQVSVATGTYAAAVQGLPKDRGIIPDIPVLHKPEDMTCGRDTVLEYALGLCR
jgi:predicted O-methyltransferase YrrM